MGVSPTPRWDLTLDCYLNVMNFSGDAATVRSMPLGAGAGPRSRRIMCLSNPCAGRYSEMNALGH